MQVLVINDSKSTLLALKGLLTSQGFDVVSAQNGLEGLEKLEQTNCQIVLLDWEMPVMDGLEFCRTVRSRDFSRYIYIIFLSGHEDTEKKWEGIDAGADDFVVSTTSRDELLKRIHIARRLLDEIPCSMMTRSMQLLLRNRHHDIEEYSNRITLYGIALLEQLKKTDKYRTLLDATFFNRFRAVCPLFDIGFSDVPKDILLNIRKTKLSSTEYAILITHPKVGGNVFAELFKEFPDSSFLAMGRDIAATHHERFDGSGYPSGLKGDAIPLVGRVVFLADSYDALTTKRGWSQPFSHDYVKWLIVEGRGIHFDPDLVDAFLVCEDYFRTVSTEVAKKEIDITL